MKKFKFEFSGFGNYSETFNWDNGLECRLLETTPEPAPNSQYGVEIETFNSFGGSRDVFGYVVAENKAEAERFLRQYQDEFNAIQVVEYVPEA